MPGRDPEEVQRENDLLTRKVHSQEEEFKLQNETIMHELNEVRGHIDSGDCCTDDKDRARSW